MSQEIRGHGKVQQGLLGLDGPVTPLKIELDTYFKIPPLPTAKLDILAWWKAQEPVLPLMAEIARIYLHLLRGCSQPQAIWSPS